jgi:hypothetical protein
MRMLTLLTVVLIGCAPTPPEPRWFGHVGALKTPAGEAAVEAIRERLKADDAAKVRVRHAEAGENARATAVRLLSVNGVKGLILGPGLSDPEEVVAAARGYEVPVIVLDEVAGPIDGALCLGGDVGPRAGALAEHVWKEEKVKAVRADEGPFAVAFRRLGGTITKDAEAEVRGLTYRRGAKVVEAVSDAPSAADALDVLIKEERADGVTKRKVTIKARE